jgi:hypothetical protein
MSLGRFMLNKSSIKHFKALNLVTFSNALQVEDARKLLIKDAFLLFRRRSEIKILVQSLLRCDSLRLGRANTVSGALRHFFNF